MYKRPIILGVDTKAFKAKGSTSRQRLADYGGNTGNAIFSEALYASVKRGRRASYHPSNEDLKASDVAVIAAANWLNEHSDFGALADRLDRFDLPVILVGLGAQSGLDKSIPRLRPGTVRLVKIAAERSTAISVRGAFTAEVLNCYGVKNAFITGCPSLLLAGEQPPKAPKLGNIEWRHVVMHATSHGRTEPVQSYLYDQAAKHGATVILQSEPRLIEGMDQRERVFWDVNEWVNELRTKHFACGSRIHGTVAALLAGIPATLIVHDARTAEMAQVMNVPSILEADIDTSEDLDLNALYDETAMERFRAGYEVYRRNFAGFFHVSGIASH